MKRIESVHNKLFFNLYSICFCYIKHTHDAQNKPRKEPKNTAEKNKFREMKRNAAYENE